MTRDELRGALKHPNVIAFLKVIREGESSQEPSAYQVMYGGGYFSSFADHPRRKNTAAGITSTAAGAYQFLEKTWDGLVAKYGFPDFSPECQDEAAVALIAGRGALQDLLRGDLSEVLDKCSWEWASLPPGRYGQPVLDAKRVYNTFDKWLAPTQVADAPEPEKPKMAIPAFAVLAFEALTTLLPTLIRYKSKSPRGEENAQLAEKVMPIVTAAVGAANEQEALAKIIADPAALQKADKAVQDGYFALIEMGGGVPAAREANEKAMSSNVPPWHNPAIIVTVLLAPLIYFAAIQTLLDPSSTAEIKTMVVSLIVGGALGSVTAFFLGSSASSRSKDDALTRAIK